MALLKGAEDGVHYPREYFCERPFIAFLKKKKKTFLVNNHLAAGVNLAIAKHILISHI